MHRKKKGVDDPNQQTTRLNHTPSNSSAQMDEVTHPSEPHSRTSLGLCPETHQLEEVPVMQQCQALSQPKPRGI